METDIIGREMDRNTGSTKAQVTADDTRENCTSAFPNMAIVPLHWK